MSTIMGNAISIPGDMVDSMHMTGGILQKIADRRSTSPSYTHNINMKSQIHHPDISLALGATWIIV